MKPSDRRSTTSPVAAPFSRPSAFAIWSALVTVYIVWGSTYLAIRFAIETLPPFLMAGARFLIAGAILYFIRRALGDPRPSKKEWRSAAVIGTFLLVGGNGGVVWAEQSVPSGLAALLVSTVPLWMVLIDTLISGRVRPGKRTMVGILLGFFGVVLLVGPAHIGEGANLTNRLGVVVLLLAPLFWSIGSLYHRRAILPASPLLGTGMEMLTGGVGLLLLGLLTGEATRWNPAATSLPSFLGWLYLVVFGSWVGFAAYIWLLRVAPTPLVATYAYVNPVVAIFLGFLWAAEPLTPQILTAAAIILGSVALTTSASSPAPSPTPETKSPPNPE